MLRAAPLPGAEVPASARDLHNVHEVLNMNSSELRSPNVGVDMGCSKVLGKVQGA